MLLCSFFLVTVNITVTKSVSTYTDIITYSCEGATGTISSDAPNGTAISWTIPDAIEDRMTTKTSATCTITCTTKNGSTTVGTSTQTLTITIPTTYVPTITWGTTTFINDSGGKLITGTSSLAISRRFSAIAIP